MAFRTDVCAQRPFGWVGRRGWRHRGAHTGEIVPPPWPGRCGGPWLMTTSKSKPMPPDPIHDGRSQDEHPANPPREGPVPGFWLVDDELCPEPCCLRRHLKAQACQCSLEPDWLRQCTIIIQCVWELGSLNFLILKWRPIVVILYRYVHIIYIYMFFLS